MNGSKVSLASQAYIRPFKRGIEGVVDGRMLRHASLKRGLRGMNAYDAFTQGSEGSVQSMSQIFVLQPWSHEDYY